MARAAGCSGNGVSAGTYCSYGPYYCRGSPERDLLYDVDIARVDVSVASKLSRLLRRGIDIPRAGRRQYRRNMQCAECPT